MMKKTSKSLIICIYLQCIQCFSDVKIGAPNYSYSIETSKKNKIFLSSYIPVDNVYIQNNKTYKIIEVWSENESFIKNSVSELDIKSDARFMIRFSNDFNDSNEIIETKKNLKDKLNLCGFTNEKMFFTMSLSDQKKDTIKIYFVNKNEFKLMRFVRTH